MVSQFISAFRICMGNAAVIGRTVSEHSDRLQLVNAMIKPPAAVGHGYQRDSYQRRSEPYQPESIINQSHRNQRATAMRES